MDWHLPQPTALALCLAAGAGVLITGCSQSPASQPPPGDGGTGTGGGSTSFPITWRQSTPVSPVFIGSGGFGYSFGSCSVSAAAPSGFVKVGPDTSGPWGTSNFLHFSGYWYGDDTIQGFSHLHLHGTGATDYGVLGVMPSDGFDASRTTPAGYQSTFVKTSESAVPGRYAVTLDRGNIAVELTATPHAAHHRYTYPSGATSAHVIFDLDHHLDGGKVTSSQVTLYPTENRVRGQLHSVGGMSGGFGGYDVFFEARTATAWTESQTWQAGSAPAAGTTAMGTGVGFELGFDPSKPVEIQVGLSMVSGDEAAANLTAEMPAFAFDATQKQTQAAWATLMGRIKFTGGTDAEQAMMTAATYHAFLMPSAQSDVDGSFHGMDGMIHSTQGSGGYHYLTDMSLWDTYRTLHPLYALIAPELSLDSVLSLHEKAKESGFFPKWPIATGEAGTMIGASAEVVLADAYLKGVTGFDAEGAYGILRAAAMDPTAPAGGRGGRDKVEPYMMLGYVPASAGDVSVSMTTEYANDDFALAALAKGLGHTADAATLTTRAVGYRKLYDPTTGFLWSKNDDGSWASPHEDPTAFSTEFDEANAWQSLWMVTLDSDGLATLAGSRSALVDKLTQMFTLTKQDFDNTDFTNTLTSSGQRPYYWAGNEPDMNAAYLFARLGRPDLTQQWIAWIRSSWFTPGADGLPGNDDGGTMSAWLLWSSLGFYPVSGSDRYVVGAPLFPHAELSVTGGTFTVDAPAVSDTNLYVQSVTLNGAALSTPELTHADLKAGGSLSFVMGPVPSTWGRSP
jgi:predicted alpha-1,2-mannosidase